MRGLSMIARLYAKVVSSRAEQKNKAKDDAETESEEPECGRARAILRPALEDLFEQEH
jgi:hypothetical protein